MNAMMEQRHAQTAGCDETNVANACSTHLPYEMESSLTKIYYLLSFQDGG